MEDGAEIWRALIMPFPIRARRRLNARISKSISKNPRQKITPRILSSYRRTSNYSSAHLTRMNDIVKVSSSARGKGGRILVKQDHVRIVPQKTKTNNRLWNMHQVRTSPRRYSVGPNRHDVRSCTQQLSHENTRFATAPGFDGPSGCPTQSRIRFRRLWLRR